MYEKKECPACHCQIYEDLSVCPFCGYDFSTPLVQENPVDNSTQQTQETHKLNFCPNCGNKINDGANFCSYCGYDFYSNNTKHEENIIHGQYTDVPKNGFIAGLLAFFLGILGFHNFYLRRYSKGFIQLITTLICYSLLSSKRPTVNSLIIGGIGMIIVYIWAFVDFWHICDNELLPIGKEIKLEKWQGTILRILRGLTVVGFIIIIFNIFSFFVT